MSEATEKKHEIFVPLKHFPPQTYNTSVCVNEYTHIFPWIARVIFYFIKFNRQNHFQYNEKQSYNSRACVFFSLYFSLWYLCVVQCVLHVVSTTHCKPDWLARVGFDVQQMIDILGWSVWSVTQISFVVVGFMWHISAIMRVMIYIFKREKNPLLSDSPTARLLADNASFFVLARFIALMKI